MGKEPKGKTMAKQTNLLYDFAPAYTISNENQRWATTAIPNVSQVLTVAGSGDQALFYKLAGAKTIHTFDRTKNARAIQDIKIAAIQVLSLAEYRKLLLDASSCGTIPNTPEARKIRPFLSLEAKHIIESPQNFRRIFDAASCNAGDFPENIPTQAEYNRLKSTLTKSFKFICSDLYDLGAKISGQYDLINISNIFDYCYDGNDKIKILIDLAQHLNVGGHIVYLPQKSGFWYPGFYLETPAFKLDYTKTLRNNDSKMILFQRTR